MLVSRHIHAVNLVALVAVAAAPVGVLGGCIRQAAQVGEQPGPGQPLVLATTTSTYDSGLLDELLPPFEEEWGGPVRVLAVGTGEALEVGRRGDADLLMVHAPEQEKAFVAEGYGVARRPLMYNDFVIVGPGADPASVRDTATATEALRAIASAEAVFVSRGDNSGTHMKEESVWQALGLAPEGDWYLSAGSSMAAVLRLASEKAGYALSDRATFLAQDGLDLTVLFEGDPVLHNPYAVIAVSPAKNPNVNQAGAQALVDFLFSPRGQAIVADFGREEHGQPLFHLMGEETGSGSEATAAGTRHQN